MAKLQDLDWNDLRFVLAVARCESLAGAARQLGVNESTVGRHVSRLEDSLGATLFERILGSFRTTKAGNEVVANAERVESLVRGLESAVSGVDKVAAGTVRVTSVPMLVNRILVPALPDLIDEHPQLRVELIAESRDLSLTRREADLALRLARPSKELGTLARRIGRLDYAVYEPLSRCGGKERWITYEDSMADLPQCQWIAEQIADDRGAAVPLKVNDAEAIVAAAVAGIGLSLLPVSVGDQTSGIRRRDAGRPVFSRELWLLTHPEMRGLVRVKVVADWLVSSVDRFTSPGSSVHSCR